MQNFIIALGAGSLGAVLIKLIDIIWLQRVLENHERKKWLRDKRLRAFTNLSKEILSMGIDKGYGSNSFKFYALASEVLLLINDDWLVKKIDLFIIELDDLGDKKYSEEENEIKYNKLWQDGRMIIKKLNQLLLRG